MTELEQNMLLNEQVTAVIERTKDPVLSFDIARLIATPVFEKLKGFEIWTDCDEDNFCASSWDQLANCPAEYALIRASILVERGEFEMACDERTILALQVLIERAQEHGVSTPRIRELMPFLTRNNSELAAAIKLSN